MLEFYQHLPNYISPIMFSIGNFSLHWYSVMWVVGFGTVYALLIWRIKKKEGNYSKSFIQDVVAYALLGAILGGRIGYVLFYDLLYYINHPIQIISPYDFATKTWTGIYGMSYHGGIIGVAIAIAVFAYINKKSILELYDFIAPVAPIGYMFGRIGNFFNGELYGRITNSGIGMYFNEQQTLRYPSQLFEAFLEGLVLFVILWSIRNKKWNKGVLTLFYIIGYSIARFSVEFFRQPDAHLGFVFKYWTMGQILSLFMLMSGFLLLIVVQYKHRETKDVVD